MISKTAACVLSRARYDAAIFDLDGVVTKTADVHAAAWKRVFDEYLETRKGRGKEFEAFDVEVDYRRHVDGKPRYEGVESFLLSRCIELPYGEPEDPPDKETVCGLGNRKNQLFHELLAEKGVRVFEHAVTDLP